MVDSREADDKSVNMEKIGFTRAMDDVIAKSATPVTEVVTDQHSQIRALMSKYNVKGEYLYLLYTASYVYSLPSFNPSVCYAFQCMISSLTSSIIYSDYCAEILHHAIPGV